MTEDEAKNWLRTHFDVSRETWEQLERFVALLLAEMEHQNLIAESTRDHVWARHIVDSAQLIRLVPPAAPGKNGALPIWADLGAGAGLPGIVIAILSGYETVMIEMRRKRIDFLESVIADLGVAHARVIGGKVESAGLPRSASVISARAYAPMERLLETAWHLSGRTTVWVLPKGQNFQNELAIATTLWQSEAQVEPSLTAPDSAILMLRHVRKPATIRNQGRAS